jgi:hypothetical protein
MARTTRAEGTTIASGASPCRVARLVADEIGAHAEGNVIFRIWITNATDAPCTLQGWPSVGITDQRGTSLPVASTPSDAYGKSEMIRLGPRKQRGAVFVLGWSNWCGVRTSGASRVYVTLPRAHALLVLPFRPVGPPRCDDAATPSRLSISPLLGQAP